MDTLEEVSESEDHPTHHPMDAEPTDPLDKMDIDY
jgi:hypothetical protein